MQDLHCSNGPVSSMPGSSHSLPQGSKCDVHRRRPAVRRVQGETDSFGCEYVLQCQRCVNKGMAAKVRLGGGDHLGFCSCSKDSPNREMVPLFGLRDYDEGMAGPLYYKCASCKSAWRQREAEEAARYFAENGDSDENWMEPYLHGDDEDDFGPEDDERERYAHESREKQVLPPVITYKRKRRVVGAVRG